MWFGDVELLFGLSWLLSCLGLLYTGWVFVVNLVYCWAFCWIRDWLWGVVALYLCYLAVLCFPLCLSSLLFYVCVSSDFVLL